MRPFLPLLLLASCSPDAGESARLHTEIAKLREELRAVSQPRLEAVAALDDLAAEVKRLRERSTPPPPPPVVVAPAAADGGPPLLGGVGSSVPGQADLYWVLTRVIEGGEERLVLALYRAAPPGLKLEAVRVLNHDLRLIEFQNGKPSVRDVLKETRK